MRAVRVRGSLSLPVAGQVTQGRRDLEILIAQRNGLQEQLKDLTTRRSQLFAELAQWPDDAVKRQIERRLREIDAHSARLDEQIARLNDQIVVATGRLGDDVPQVGIPEIKLPQIPAPRQLELDFLQVGLLMAGEGILLALISLAFWRFGMRRMRSQFERAFMSQATQLQDLQRSIDTVAVETERISEAQRFVAKTLTDGGLR